MAHRFCSLGLRNLAKSDAIIISQISKRDGSTCTLEKSKLLTTSSSVSAGGHYNFQSGQINEGLQSIQKRYHSNQSLEDFLELKIDTKDDVTHVEAVPVPTGREGLVVQVQSELNKEACSLCRLNLKNLAYTDVMIISQFIKKDGSLATIEESKLCAKQYKRVKMLIAQAQRCNLIERPADYLVPGAWHDLNTYLERDRKRDQPMKVIKKQYWKL